MALSGDGKNRKIKGNFLHHFGEKNEDFYRNESVMNNF